MMLTKLTWIKKPIYRELYAVCLAYQINVIYGVTLAYSAYLLPQLWAGDFGFEVNKESAQLIGSSGIMLRPIGIIINIYIADKFGRMCSLRLTFLLLIFSWISVSLAWNSNVLIVTRLLNGLICGCMVGGSVYIYEIAVGNMSALYVSLLPANMTIGGSLISFVMYFLDWRTTGWILSVHSVVTFAFLCTLPESPYWYVMQGRLEDAEQSLRWFGRLADLELREHLNKMQMVVDAKPPWTSKLRCALQPSVRNTFAVFFLLTIFDRICGYLVVNNFSVEFFDNLQTIFDSGKIALLFGIVCFLSSLSICWLIYLIDLRKLMIYSSIGMIGCSLLAAVLYKSLRLSDDDRSNAILQIGIIVCVFLYTILLYSCNGEGIWIMAVKVFPTIAVSTLYGTLEIIDMLVAAVLSYFAPYVIYSREFFYLFLTLTVSSAFILYLVSRIPKNIMNSN